jgi:hypothetical protein
LHDTSSTPLATLSMFQAGISLPLRSFLHVHLAFLFLFRPFFGQIRPLVPLALLRNEFLNITNYLEKSGVDQTALLFHNPINSLSFHFL